MRNGKDSQKQPLFVAHKSHSEPSINISTVQNEEQPSLYNILKNQHDPTVNEVGTVDLPQLLCSRINTRQLLCEAVFSKLRPDFDELNGQNEAQQVTNTLLKFQADPTVDGQEIAVAR